MAGERDINVRLVWPSDMADQRDVTINLASPTTESDQRSVAERLVSPSLTIFGLYVSLMVTISSVLRVANLVTTQRDALTAIFKYLSLGGLFVGFEVLVVLVMLLGYRIRAQVPIVLLMFVVLYLLGGLVYYNLKLI